MKPQEIKEEPKKEILMLEEEPEKPVVQEIIIDGLHLVYNGTYKAEQIQLKAKQILCAA